MTLTVMRFLAVLHVDVKHLIYETEDGHTGVDCNQLTVISARPLHIALLDVCVCGKSSDVVSKNCANHV